MRKPSFLNICKMSQPVLKKYVFEYLKKMEYKPVMKDGFVYAKGTVPVLLVAHMDTVHRELPKNIEINNGIVKDANGIGGDDRCGVYMILKIAKKIKCSILFTEDEEIGCVGALKFCNSEFIDKLDVNYIIELDRKGKDDAVFYDCDNPKFTAFATDKEIGFKEDWGTFTDISHICEYSGIAGVNFSCGYFNAHSVKEYVNVPIMENNIRRVMKLINKPVDEPFEYIRAEGYYSGYSFGGGWYDDYSNYWYGNRRNDYGGKTTSYGSSGKVVSGTTKKLDDDGKSGKKYCMEIEYYDIANNKVLTSVTSAETKEGCFYQFFVMHPDVCYNKILDWTTYEVC